MTELEKDIEKISGHQTKALGTLAHLRASYIEGTQEAFAYLALGDLLEKQQFFERMERFDILAFEYKDLE